MLGSRTCWEAFGYCAWRRACLRALRSAPAAVVSFRRLGTVTVGPVTAGRPVALRVRVGTEGRRRAGQPEARVAAAPREGRAPAGSEAAAPRAPAALRTRAAREGAHRLEPSRW